MGGGSSSTTRKNITKIDRDTTTNVAKASGSGISAQGDVEGAQTGGTRIAGDMGLTGQNAVSLVDELGAAVAGKSDGKGQMTNQRTGKGSGGAAVGKGGGARSGFMADVPQVAWVIGGVLAAGGTAYFVFRN